MTGISLGVTNTNNQSFGIQNNNFSKGKNSVYAIKGESMYQKEMDADEDGVITFDEFNEYCDANGIDYKMRILLLNNRMMYKFSKDNEENSKKVKEEAEKAEEAKASEDTETQDSTQTGDVFTLDEIINSDKEEKLTYEEYMKYCEAQAETAPKIDLSSKAEPVKIKDSETQEEKIIVKNYGKALKSYTVSENASATNKAKS